MFRAAIEKVANFQLWNADDYEHRLKPNKLKHIINLAQEKLAIPDLEIEVEYQTETIGKYNLDYNGSDFLLIPKQTACLAMEACGVPNTKETVASCAPGSGCC